MNPQQDLLLDADDQVFIRRIPGWQVGPRGGGARRGPVPRLLSQLSRDSTTLKMILTQAGGFYPRSVERRGQIAP